MLPLNQLYAKAISCPKTWGCCQTGYIDYDKLEEKALDFRPRMIICGGSAYPREWDYARLSAIVGKIGALLMCDMAHYRRAPIRNHAGSRDDMVN